MKRLERKLRDEGGASILLALLLFLVCIMVGASVLAEAASNAGKARSNRVEQQKYLTLSSAVRLVADELVQAKYMGAYKLWEWTVTTTVTDSADPAHPVVTTTTENFFYCVQTGCGTPPADYSCGDLTAQLPLGKELDEIFSGEFTKRGGAAAGYAPLGGADVEPATVRTLTVTLPEGLAGYPEDAVPEQYQAPREVTVQVKLDHDTNHILLTAWLEDDTTPPPADERMTAELVAKAGSIPALSYSPSGRLPLPAGETPPETGSTVTTTAGTVETKKEITVERAGETLSAASEPLQWELNWIRRGTA